MPPDTRKTMLDLAEYIFTELCFLSWIFTRSATPSPKVVIARAPPIMNRGSFSSPTTEVIRKSAPIVRKRRIRPVNLPSLMSDSRARIRNIEEPDLALVNKSVMQKNANIKKYVLTKGKRRRISPRNIYMPWVLYSCVSFIHH
ncbi:Uncharacterised protein [uncultured archaeon]|nr:Uncharacterised protein [uncultured archaeon]